MTAAGAAKVWIVSPVFYDAESYRQLRSEILAALQERASWRDVTIEFVVVDDSGAVDAPTRTLRELPSTRVVSPPFNLGHQRAIVFGLRAIRPELHPDDYVVTLDADGEDQPSDVVRLLSEAKSRSVERQLVVLGRRTTRNESVKFRTMYLAFKMLFRVMTGKSIASGNFAVQRGYFVLNTIDHPTFDLCFSTSLIALRRPISYVPCARGRRYAGQSRMNTFGLVAHGIRMMLPFAENLAVRLLTISCGSFVVALLAGVGALVAVGAGGLPFMPFAIGVVLAVLVGTVT
ncbi:MAG: glycosyltransferase, partial [Actinomycetota bacterium]